MVSGQAGVAVHQLEEAKAIISRLGADGEVARVCSSSRGGRVVDEGVELVRVWMMPGLEEVAHS
jgi:hypothetical protein